MDLDLSGRTALVTSATSGIGLATAAGLARQGAEVWINGRNEQRLEGAAEKIRERVPGARVHTALGDVSNADGVQSVIDVVDDVDILVNMAGGTNNTVPFTELTDEDWQYQWEYNVMSGVRLSRHYIPKLMTKDFGRIIFLSSEAGIITGENVIDGVCKAAVIRLSRAIAELFAGTNVTVNCVVPGPTVSDWVLRAADGRDLDEFAAEFFPANQPNSLLQRFAEADEVANLILYLCSPASTVTRGAVLRAEGGSIRTSS